MEIERKYLIRELPERLEQYPCRQIEQGYLNTDPVVRIRRTDEQYTLTYKGKGFMVREEYNLPLNKKAFLHLRKKIDGILIKKRRYLIPFETYNIELDVFEGALAPLMLAEVDNQIIPIQFLSGISFVQGFRPYSLRNHQQLFGASV